jgi:hypothetical protein
MIMIITLPMEIIHDKLENYTEENRNMRKIFG